jgi:signal transduction histidine kinase
MHGRQPRFSPPLVEAMIVVVVAAVALGGLLAPVLLVNASWDRVGPAAVALAVIQAAALWRRRRHPLAVLAVTLAALLLAQALGDENAASFYGPHVAAYTAATYPLRRALIALGFVAAAALLELLLRWFDASEPSGLLFGFNGVLVAIAWGIGRYVRVRRAYVETLVAYAQQLETDRDEQARQAVLEERRRIARELHDQVAHHLGVVALQTGAARRWLVRDRERADAAMKSAEQSVRTALTTMPVILEALRADTGAELAPQAGLDDLGDLVARVAAAGLPVELSITGDRRPLDPAVESTAYRIVQEALTNTIKHAGPTHASVQLRFASNRLDVEVNDDGYGLAATRKDGGGFGLIGMRERIDLLGGQLVAAAGEGGGFTVRATLPLQPEHTPP